MENIDDPCYFTLAVNPKSKYFEFFKDYSTNKKGKGIKKGSKGMDFENYAERIKSLKNFQQPKNEYKQVTRFTVKKEDMVTTTVTKAKFFQIIDKRFYFPNGILFLPYGHPSLK